MEFTTTISGQLTLDDIKVLAEQGIKSIVNNRPDNEEAGQPSNAELQAAAEALGIAYRHIPFSGGMLEMRHVEEFADFYNSTERPLHMFCRTGNRSNTLLQAARERDMLDEE